MGCLKPHRRVDDAETMWALRERLGKDLDALGGGRDNFWRLAETHDYMKALFNHLTRGRKVLDPTEPQANPAPVPPEWWTAGELFDADAFVLSHTVRKDL